MALIHFHMQMSEEQTFDTANRNIQLVSMLEVQSKLSWLLIHYGMSLSVVTQILVLCCVQMTISLLNYQSPRNALANRTDTYQSL